MKILYSLIAIMILLCVSSYGVLTTDLEHYYPLDTDSTDSVGVMDGSDTSIDYNNAKLGTASAYSNTNTDNINFGDYDLSTDFSICMWIDIDNPTAQTTLALWKADAYGISQYNAVTGCNDNWAFSLYTNAAPQWESVCTTTEPATGYHYVCGVLDGGDILVYYDGSWEATTTIVGTLLESNNDLLLPYGGGIGAIGNFDELGFWERALSAAEITELYNSGNGLAYPFLTASNLFDIFANNTYNLSQENLFNVTITNMSDYNNTWYFATTNNTIVTNLSTTLGHYINITIQSDGYVTQNLLNINVSNDLTFNITPYMKITLNNTANLTPICDFNITYGSYLWESENCEVITRSGIYSNETLSDCVIRSEDYINYNISINNDAHNSYNISQSWVKVNATAIHSLNIISYLNLTNGWETISTDSDTLFFPSNLGTFSWNFSNNEGYYNSSDLSFTIDEPYDNITVTGLYDTTMTFFGNKTIASLAPTCTYSGGLYTIDNSTGYKSNAQDIGGNVSCSAYFYEDIVFSIENTSFPQSPSIFMEPNELHLVFTEDTEGWIETIDCQATDCYNFTGNNTIIVTRNLSTGYITVRFNNDTSGNWQQVFTYYNNDTTSIKEYIKIITPDLVQQVKVTGESNPLYLSRVCADELGVNPETGNNEWLTVFCDYTDVDGLANLLINDQNNYRFCVQADGFTSDCFMEYIPPSNANIFIFDLEGVNTITGYDYIVNSCNGYVYNDTSCTIDIYSYKPYNTICINYTYSDGSGASCTSDSIGKSYTFNVNNLTNNYNFTIYLDGIEALRTYTYKIDDPTVADIGWGSKLQDEVKSSKELLIGFYIIILAFGIFVGYKFEQWFIGYGIYGSAGFFGVVALGFPIFWIGVAPAFLYFIFDRIIPMWK